MTKKPKAYTLRLFATGDGDISIKDLATTPLKAPASGPVDLTHRAQNWIWTKVRKGGAWDGSFTITGTIAELKQLQREWLAYRIEESVGIPNWVGLVWTMELSGVNIPRRVSLDQVDNAIRSEYREHLANTGFEESGSGGDTFAGWTDSTGTIADETTLVARDGHAVRLANNGSNGIIYQDVTVEAKAEYRFTVYTRGDGSAADGSVAIQDVTGGTVTLIDEATGVTQDQYRRVTYEFVTPASATTIRVVLYNTNSQSVYFDQASLVRLIDGRPGNSWTDFYTNVPSINRYGRKERTINAREKSRAEAEALAQTELKRRAWPRITASGLTLGTVSDKPTLTVYCVGYIVTTLYLYAPAGKGYEVDGGTLMKEAIDDKADFVTSRNISTLGVKTRFSQDNPPRVYDLIQTITSEGASSDGIVAIKVDKDRGVSILPILKTQPRYYLRDGQLYDSPGSKNPTNARLVEPGLVKDLDDTGDQGFYDDIFDNSSLFIMEGVEVDDQNSIQPFDAPPSLKIDAESR